MNRRLYKWLPAVGVPVAIVAAATLVPLQASAAVDLPDKTPQEVLAMIGADPVSAFSGTIEQTSELGLPDLSGIAMPGGTDASALDLLTGTHKSRVFVDGATKSRVQVLDSLAERNVIRNGSDLWYFDSESQEAVHATLPDTPADVEEKLEKSLAEAPTPAEVADRFVSGLESTTDFAVDDDTSVAGRTAYTLVLTPKDSETLVASVSITVDSETGLPLSVDVRADGQSDPVFEIAFTKLELTAPSSDTFAFAPSAGMTVTEQEVPTKGAEEAPAAKEAHTPPTVIGSGWSSVVSMAATEVPAEFADSPLMAQVTEAVAGGRVFSTTLVNVLFTDDGRVLAGAVSTDRLLAAADGR